MNSEKAIAGFNTLSKIVEQLSWCGYESEGGPLVNNVAFIALTRMAVNDPQAEIDGKKVGLETCGWGPHDFPFFSDHPRDKDGLKRCPYCMAVGIDRRDAEIDGLTAEVEERAYAVADLVRDLSADELEGVLDVLGDLWEEKALADPNNSFKADLTAAFENQTVVQVFHDPEEQQDEIARLRWVPLAYARLGVLRDKMNPLDVAAVQKFLGEINELNSQTKTTS